MLSNKRGANDRRPISASGRKLMERRRRGKRRGHPVSDALSADGCVLKAGAATLLACAILGLSLQDADQSRGARHSIRGDKMMENREGSLPLLRHGSSAGNWVESLYDGAHGIFDAFGNHGVGDGDNDKGGVDHTEFHAAFSREPPHMGREHSRDPAEGVSLVFPGEVERKNPIEDFLDQGGKLPVVLLTCNRLELLRNTTQSLRQVRGMDMSNVMVFQDGNDKQVAQFVRGEGLDLHQNIAGSSYNLRAKSKDGAAKIARHYKFALDHAFLNRREAPAVIIVEDDLLFSPDFLEFFEHNAPILERDPSTFILSAWNDNGYKGKVTGLEDHILAGMEPWWPCVQISSSLGDSGSKIMSWLPTLPGKWSQELLDSLSKLPVSDKTELKRTNFFPGLGWLLPRQLYEQELKAKWPENHWDHWLRDPKQHRERECVFPEVPRTYHAGIRGTFMDQQTHDHLFKNVDYNTDATFSWESVSEANGFPTYAKAMKDNYEKRVEARISVARHVNDVKDITAEPSQESPSDDVVFWYSLPMTEEKGKMNPFKTIADTFGLWHQYRRTEHNHMHSFRYWNGGEELNVMIINEAKSTYKKFKPRELKPAQGGLALTPLHHEPIGSDVHVFAARELSKSCTLVCEEQGLTCSENSFGQLNSCHVLKNHFPCETCLASIGEEQPCYVDRGAPSIYDRMKGNGEQDSHERFHTSDEGYIRRTFEL